MEEIIFNELKNIADEAIDINKKQLENGLLPSGLQTPVYSPFTLKIKREKNSLFGNGINWSLRDSGDLYSKMEMEKTLFGARIFSKSSHIKPLSKQASKRGMSIDEFFGLTDEEMSKFMSKLQINVQKKIRNFIYGL